MKLVLSKVIDTDDIVAKLKERSMVDNVDNHNMAGMEVYVDKQLLSDAADIIEKLVRDINCSKIDKINTKAKDIGISSFVINPVYSHVSSIDLVLENLFGKEK